MKKPNKIYNLTIVYNKEEGCVEYIEESLTTEDNSDEDDSYVMYMPEDWYTESLDFILDHYLFAEA